MRILVFATMLGIGAYLCVATTPWLFTDRAASPIVLVELLGGWFMVWFGIKGIYKAVWEISND